MMYDDDALDRLLENLALEEPPRGLRESILAATAYAPPPAFSHLETVTLGVIGAVALWLIVAVVMGGSALFEHSISTIGSTLGATLSNVDVLAWIALGISTVLWLSIFTGPQSWTALRERAAERRPR